MNKGEYDLLLEYAPSWEAILSTINNMLPVINVEFVDAYSLKNFYLGFDEGFLEAVRNKTKDNLTPDHFIVNHHKPFIDDGSVENGNAAFSLTVMNLLENEIREIIPKASEYFEIFSLMPILEAFYLFRLFLQKILDVNANGHVSLTDLAIDFALIYRNLSSNTVFLKEIVWFYNLMILKQVSSIKSRT